jgi:hypothetical protein
MLAFEAGDVLPKSALPVRPDTGAVPVDDVFAPFTRA